MNKIKWLIPCNTRKYDIFKAFKKYKVIDWHISNSLSSVKIGDSIYIYCGVPNKKIMFKCQVIDIVGEKEKINDDEFNLEESNVDEGYDEYIRIKLINQYDTEKLNLETLMKFGLKSAPRGPLRITEKPELDVYISNVENNKI